jgi:hypothetical protein
MAAPMMAPNGTCFGGWLLNTADNEFQPRPFVSVRPEGAG